MINIQNYKIRFSLVPFFPCSHGMWWVITTWRTNERSLHCYLREYVLKDSLRGILQDSFTSQNDDLLIVKRNYAYRLDLGTTTGGSLGQDTTLSYWEVCELPSNSSFGTWCAPIGRGYRAGCQCAPVDWLILASQRLNYLGSQWAPTWCFPHLVAHEHHSRGVTGRCADVLPSTGKSWPETELIFQWVS